MIVYSVILNLNRRHLHCYKLQLIKCKEEEKKPGHINYIDKTLLNIFLLNVCHISMEDNMIFIKNIERYELNYIRTYFCD